MLARFQRNSVFRVVKRCFPNRDAADASRMMSNVQIQSDQDFKLKLFNPTDEHQSLREMVRTFVESEVDPQALEYNRLEKFNVKLFKKLGDLGLLGITVEPEYGGSGMDAVAAVIVHGI